MSDAISNGVESSKKTGFKPKKENSHRDTSHRNALVNPNEFLILNQHPSRRYRFLSKKMLNESGGLDRRGWEPITAANSMGEELGTHWGTKMKSGTELRNGDLVVGFMPVERHEARQAMLQQRQNAFQEALNMIKNRARSLNMPHNINVSIQRPGRSDFEVREGVED